MFDEIKYSPLVKLLKQIKSVSREDMKTVQKEINELGGNLVADGIFGSKSLDAIKQINQKYLFENLVEELTNKKYLFELEEDILEHNPPDHFVKSKVNSFSKKVIMDYLAIAEGTTVHFNKGEDTITSPYGIYKASFPNAKIFDYMNSKLQQQT